MTFFCVSASGRPIKTASVPRLLSAAEEAGSFSEASQALELRQTLAAGRRPRLSYRLPLRAVPRDGRYRHKRGRRALMRRALGAWLLASRGQAPKMLGAPEHGPRASHEFAVVE